MTYEEIMRQITNVAGQLETASQRGDYPRAQKLNKLLDVLEGRLDALSMADEPGAFAPDHENYECF